MILVFDTETTAFPSPSLPVNHLNQARIVQLAWILLDEQFVERACFNSLIQISVATRITEGAFKVHGISEMDCRNYGMPIEQAIQPLLYQTRTSSVIVGYNISFDSKMLDIECENIFGLTDERWFGCGMFCVMEAMTPICQLPFANGRKGHGSQRYKWPTLQEAYQFAFEQQFEGAHDALADVRATARIYRWLKEREAGMKIS